MLNDDDELVDQIFVSQAHADAPLRYRADYSDPETYTPLEPVYEDLRAAQQRCEDELRAQRADGPQLEFRWIPDQNQDSGFPAAQWCMQVRTPRTGGDYLALGYSVAVVGSWADGVARGALDHG